MVLTASAVSEQRRERLLKSLDRLPKMSGMTMKLLSGLARPDCEINQLASLLEQDPSLSAQLLRMANSAKFGRIQIIETIPHAISMVGIGMTRKMALAVSICTLFSRPKTPPNFSQMRFNIHSVATATLAELLAEEVPVENPQSAYVAGLFHDVGKLLIAVNAPDLFEEVLAVSAVKGSSPLETERELLGIDHAELSQLALSSWGLSEPIRLAVRYHHSPKDALFLERPARGRIGLSTAIHAANAFVNQLGMSLLPTTPNLEKTPTLEILGYQIPQDRILKRFHEEWQHLNELFV